MLARSLCRGVWVVSDYEVIAYHGGGKRPIKMICAKFGIARSRATEVLKRNGVKGRHWGTLGERTWRARIARFNELLLTGKSRDNAAFEMSMCATQLRLWADKLGLPLVDSKRARDLEFGRRAAAVAARNPHASLNDLARQLRKHSRYVRKCLRLLGVDTPGLTDGRRRHSESRLRGCRAAL